MTAWEITNTLAALLMPPGCTVLVTVLGLLLVCRRRALGVTLIAVSSVALYAFSMPILSSVLMRSVEEDYSDPTKIRNGDAIVVLGGGLYYRAPEYGSMDTVTPQVLARLRYGAQLYRTLHKPVLVTGGSPRGERSAEADVMKHVLEDEYSVPVRWAEKASNNTTENAKLSFQLVEHARVRTVYLVTHAWHMPRARASFERAGFTVIPAPTLFKTDGPRTIVDFLPDAGALENSSIWAHEIMGRAWYRLKSVASSRS
jgi:uncharacterized SAM-binding protein YcdF (DUF218 family)